ncbi:MAG: cation-translocating P-type ATPase [Armatimonadota bacterium]
MTDINSATITGLHAAEAAERLRVEGANELPSARPRRLWHIAVDVAREPMFLLLMAGGITYLLLGDRNEALVLLAFVLLVMGITFFQERKTERALAALRELSSPRALVIRDGKALRIPGREVVRGDIMLLREGDRVPADGVVISGTNLTVDESLLTGESVPVRKQAEPDVTTIGRPGGEDTPFVYSGTLVTGGQGMARVVAIGAQTEIGRIGHALRKVKGERTPLQRQTARLIWRLALIGGGLSVLVVIIYGLTRGHWLNGILVGITLAMAILPDEFAVVLVIFLALGAWRMSRQHVLTRRVPAIETLGAATVLCVDKTGTLTQNRMTVSMLNTDGFFYHLPEKPEAALPDEVHRLVEYAILASQRDPFDPMERAIKELGERTLAHTEHLHSDWEMVREYPLSPQLLAMSHVWRSPDGEDYVIAAKGAPEAVADLCHLTPEQWHIICRDIQTLTAAGMRVIGVAKAHLIWPSLPGQQHDILFNFVGLIGLIDPVRPDVPAAIRECANAGVRVVMITGDYPGTAQTVARTIGLPRPGEVITGAELEEMSDDELRQRIRTTNIFARMVPEQKLRLVHALRANGEVVAMTGDGVNDAPALQAAHIGVAMGERGTDVAREAADLVLLDDSFSSLVAAIAMGRRVYANLNKAMAYILAIHIPIAGMTLIPVILEWPLILLPVHIAFLHMIIDPAGSIAFEAEPADPETMHRPPRSPREPLFSGEALFISMLQGGVVLISVLAVFVIAWARGQGELDARTLMFTTLIFANMGLMLVNRSWSHTVLSTLHVPNASVWWIITGAVIFLALAIYAPPLQALFRFTALHPDDIVLCLLVGAASTLWFEAFKRFFPAPYRVPAPQPA